MACVPFADLDGIFILCKYGLLNVGTFLKSSM